MTLWLMMYLLAALAAIRQAAGVEIGQLPNEQHGVSGTLHVTDSRTLSFEGFNYDGLGPDVFLYYYTPERTVDRTGGGEIIPLPSSVGQPDGRFQGRRFTNEDFTVTLPTGTNVCDIGTLTIWCRRFQAIFTRIAIPRNIFVNNGAEPCTLVSAVTSVSPTPQPTMLPPTTSTDTESTTSASITSMSTNTMSPNTIPEPTPGPTVSTTTIPEPTPGPTVSTTSTATSTIPPTTPISAFDNCIPLHETLHLSWSVDTNNSQVRFMMCGCRSLDASTNQYMGFGLSGSLTRILMFGADPTIAWVDSATGQPNAVDYHLSAYTQCRAGVGACPDTMDSSGTCSNDVSEVTGFIRNGQQCVAFTRPFSTSDTTCDRTMDPSQNQYIVWAVGGLGETAFKHFIRAETGRDSPLHLGRTPQNQCSSAQLFCGGCQPFRNERIITRDDATFLAQIGPSGNERGYMGITGRAGWGIAWYINGTLIPELIVERNKTYTFIVEGGTDPNALSNYHPLYISDSIGGGRLQNTQQERDNETVFAGFDEEGREVGIGPLCQLTETATSENIRQRCDALPQYIATLREAPGSSCNSGRPGTLVWVPDENTPNTVYYQCATHLNLGWRITVLNEGDPIPTTAPPPTVSLSTDPPTTESQLPGTPPSTCISSRIEIGQLPNEQHGVSGTLYVTDARTLSFEGFNYDGLGPGAFLYYYAPGQAVDRTGGGVIIPLPSSVGQSDGSFQRRRYSNEDFTVTLPEGTDLCDIGTLTIWCRPFQAIFTRIEIPRNIFVNNGADPCTLALTRTEIGQLPTEQHGVSGTLYVTESRTLSFEGFNYDGLGPGAFLYYYAPGQAVDRTGGGVIIPLPSSVGQSDGSFQRRRYSNEDFTVTLPEGTDLCDIGTLTIWCRPFQAIFTRIEIPRNIFVNNGADPCTLAVNNGTDPCTLATAQSGAIQSAGASLFVASLLLVTVVALNGY